MKFRAGAEGSEADLPRTRPSASLHPVRLLDRTGITRDDVSSTILRCYSTRLRQIKEQPRASGYL